jgi:hypothetical protein
MDERSKAFLQVEGDRNGSILVFRPPGTLKQL